MSFLLSRQTFLLEESMENMEKFYTDSYTESLSSRRENTACLKLIWEFNGVIFNSGSIELAAIYFIWAVKCKA